MFRHIRIRFDVVYALLFWLCSSCVTNGELKSVYLNTRLAFKPHAWVRVTALARCPVIEAFGTKRWIATSSANGAAFAGTVVVVVVVVRGIWYVLKQNMSGRRGMGPVCVCVCVEEKRCTHSSFGNSYV